MTQETSIIAYHGTATAYEGNPDARTCPYGLTGVYLTDDADDAIRFAYEDAGGEDDGEARVYSAEIDMSDSVDLSDMDDHDEIIAAADEADEAVVILPDMSGVSEREILVKWAGAIRWTGVEYCA